MNNDLDYKQIPQGYLHCLSADCTRSADCLRFKVGMAAGESVSYFKIVNPAYAKKQEDCHFFQPDQKVRLAYGITHLYDNLTKRNAEKLWKLIHNYIGNAVYYRIRNKERAIRPEEEAFIRKAFLEAGITEEPQFDEYKEQYDFSER